MNFVTLVTTFHKSEEEIKSLIVHNNLQGRVLVGDQCGQASQKELGQIGKAEVTLYFFDSKGLSNNRNALLQKTNADIVSFADDDIVFIDNYPGIVLEDFERHPDAQMIRYNITSSNPQRPIPQISKEKKVGFHQVSKYGVWGFFFKRSFLIGHQLSFHPELGPGVQKSHGEDTVYLKEFMDQKPKAYQIPLVIGTTPMANSSWYGQDVQNDIVTEGYVYRLNRKKMAMPFGIYRYFVHRSFFPGISLNNFIKLFRQGIREADAYKTQRR